VVILKIILKNKKNIILIYFKVKYIKEITSTTRHPLKEVVVDRKHPLKQVVGDRNTTKHPLKRVVGDRKYYQTPFKTSSWGQKILPNTL
jgi:hypothetical protein